jgi:hypothetical protein
MTRHNKRRVSRTDLLAAAGVLDLMSFDLPVRDAEERTSRSNYMTKRLLDVFKGRLSASETALWTASWKDANAPIGEQQKRHLFDKFDDVLIGEAAALGWRVFESVSVLTRIAKWCEEEDKGLDKIRRFNAAITRYAEVKRGISQLPFIEPEWYATRKQALREIKALREELCSRFAKQRKRRTLSLNHLRAEIGGRVAAKPLQYPYLMLNLTSFIEYLKRHDSSYETVFPLTTRFATRQVTPAALVDGWFDYQGGTAHGKSRQIISRLRSPKQG